MSWLQNVWVSKCLDLYAEAQCLGGTMSGWQNVWVSKCLGVKKGVSNVLVSKGHVPNFRRIQPGQPSSLLALCTVVQRGHWGLGLPINLGIQRSLDHKKVSHTVPICVMGFVDEISGTF